MPKALLALCAVIFVAAMDPAGAQRSSDVKNTVHNLSASGPGSVKAAPGGENQICVFCHTPHGADASVQPLWNKTIAAKTYTVYTSRSLDAETILGTSLLQPLGSSKLCLSCHDGAMALGNVRVLRGVNNPTAITVANTGAGGIMPPGSGTATGYTRNIGAGALGQTTGFDLTNDHPISVTYVEALALRDGELRVPNATTQQSTEMVGTYPLFGKRASGQSTNRPVLPLDPTGPANVGQVQCTTCHDPHIKAGATDTTNELNIKFLRRPRFQGTTGPGASYVDGNDIMCLGCHDKGMQGTGGLTWANSAHANPAVATQLYRSGVGSAAEIRQFPANIPVWRASCLNCHDTHTVTGSRRLLREGSSGALTGTLALGGFQTGGAGLSAIEETCYQCHRDAAGSILASSTTVPDIRTDFNIAGGYYMPITSANQDGAGAEKHDPGSGGPTYGEIALGFNDGSVGGIVKGPGATSGSNCNMATNACGADLVESQILLGKTAANNRHVECTDCHNPHRVAKNKLFYGAGGSVATPDASGTHNHTDTAMTHTNLASGVLRGTWGVEPIAWASNSFHSSVTSWTVRRGDPGAKLPNNGITMPLSNGTMDTDGFVTREYQVCLKCHSTYGFTTPPALRASAARRGLTASGTNGLTDYTDQAKEFQSPTTHATEPASVGHDGGANNGNATNPVRGNFDTNNHRSWHPVMRSTGRTIGLRGITTGNPWHRPWSNAVGTQTMYCSDCHGSAVTTGNGVKSDGTAETGNTGIGTVIPNGGENGSPWGPHGSSNPFILKGVWDSATVTTTSTNLLCFKCHDRGQYAVSGNSGADISSGFCCDNKGNLHKYHMNRIGSIQCSWCHTAVPHGWKNKAFLVNLNDVGVEANAAYSGTTKEVNINAGADYYTQSPYYLQAKLKIINFSPSGQWSQNNCNSAQKAVGDRINSTNGNATNRSTDAAGNGLDWMKATCGGSMP